MMAKELAAYEAALSMHRKFPRQIPKPQPDAFGLTNVEAADASPSHDPGVLACLERMRSSHLGGAAVRPAEKE